MAKDRHDQAPRNALVQRPELFATLGVLDRGAHARLHHLVQAGHPAEARGRLGGGGGGRRSEERHAVVVVSQPGANETAARARGRQIAWTDHAKGVKRLPVERGQLLGRGCVGEDLDQVHESAVGGHVVKAEQQMRLEVGAGTAHAHALALVR